MQHKEEEGIIDLFLLPYGMITIEGVPQGYCAFFLFAFYLFSMFLHFYSNQFKPSLSEIPSKKKKKNVYSGNRDGNVNRLAEIILYT